MGLPWLEALEMGTTAELSQVGQSCAHARLEAGQGLPAGSPTYHPQPQL